MFGFVVVRGRDGEAGVALPRSAAGAAGMMIRRFIAAALLLGGASLLGACSSMADMWPHWAGGEPAGLPPRPGQPGYEQFIAHGEPNQNPPAAPAPQQAPVAQQAPAGTTAAIAERKSAAPEQKPPAFAEPQGQERNDAEPLPEPAEQPANDSGVVRGGLY
jgi:hypothetical protein